MKIKELCISNLRSIVDSGSIPVLNLLALVGENNAGKSNTLIAVRAFLSGGSGGIKKDDFFDPEIPIKIKITFDDLNDFEKTRWKKYLAASQLILEKQIWLDSEADADAYKIKSEYHGYESQPVDWFLSPSQIVERNGNRPRWADIVRDNGLPEYFLEDGRCNKQQFIKALDRYLEENEVDYNEPDLSETQALGLQSKVISSLPSFHLLPAITDYSDEIDKRQKTSTFRKLMGELSDRILRNDPRYNEVEEALARVQGLLNDLAGEGTGERLVSLGTIEAQIGTLLRELMPSVSSVNLSVQIDEIKDLFSGGVALSVNDGVETDVLAKGHGLQRCIVFSLLRTLIETEKEHRDDAAQPPSSIILGIEEPELYIHPQLCKLFYDVMRAFGETDQVLYTTHSPIFIDAYHYKEVAVAAKPSVEIGTKIKTASEEFFEDLNERKIFKGLSRFNPGVNELFFAKNVLLLEGPEDLIATTSTLLKIGVIRNRIEEIGWTPIVAGGKEAIPFFQRVMNSFEIPYSVLHDTDINESTPPAVADNHRRNNETIETLSAGRPIHRYPFKLEDTLGLDNHLRDQYLANQFFADPNNINDAIETIIRGVFNL